MARIPCSQFEKFFPKEPGGAEIFDLIYFEELHEYLLAIGPKVSSAEVSGEQYWKSLTPLRRHKLLELFSDVDERKQLMSAEKNLRRRIANLDTPVKVEEIYDLVEKDIRLVRKFESVGDLAYNLVCTSFGAVLDAHLNWIGGIAGGAAAGFGAGHILKGRMVKAKAKTVLEFALPRIQVANYVRSKKSDKG
jgi:hypothetical protein